MPANAEILIFLKWDKFDWTSEFPFLTGLCVFSKMKNVARIILCPDNKSLRLLQQMLMPRELLILMSNLLDYDHYHIVKLSKTQLLVLHPK